MKKIVKKVLPKPIYKWLFFKKVSLKLFRNFYCDYKIYLMNSGMKDTKKDRVAHEADLVNYYHRIEKGLAFQYPRKGFGIEVIKTLLESLEMYLKKYGWDQVSYDTYNVLTKYCEFNSEIQETYFVGDKLDQLKIKYPIKKEFQQNSGILNITDKQIKEVTSQINFKDFTNNRFSVRNFAPNEIPIEQIKEAISIAQKSPSVCNRQLARVHLYSTEEMKKKALSIQNGNTGFGHLADKVIIVTSDLRGLHSIGERNQAYIDGGIFAMSLIYALHSFSLGTCALNLALESEKSEYVKRLLDIPPNEVLITMVAVGHLPKQLKVAASNRKSLNEIYVEHK